MDDRQRDGEAEEARAACKAEKIREEIEILISDSLFGLRRLRETLASGGTGTSAYWLVHHVNRIHDLLGELEEAHEASSEGVGKVGLRLYDVLGTSAFDEQLIRMSIRFSPYSDSLDTLEWFQTVPKRHRGAARYIVNRAVRHHLGMVTSLDTLDSIRAYMASEARRLVGIGALTFDGFTYPDEDISVYAEPQYPGLLQSVLVARWEQPDVPPEEDNG